MATMTVDNRGSDMTGDPRSERAVHTPGPWKLWHNEAGAFVISHSDAVILCQRNEWNHRAAESIANARLIAAAPELLAALQELSERLRLDEPWDAVEMFDDVEPINAASKRALGAIAKATGGAP